MISCQYLSLSASTTRYSLAYQRHIRLSLPPARRPGLDPCVLFVLDDRPHPADAFAPPQVGCALLLRFASLDTVPESGLLLIVLDVTPAADPSAMEPGLGLNEVTSKYAVDLLDVPQPVAAVVGQT